MVREQIPESASQNLAIEHQSVQGARTWGVVDQRRLPDGVVVASCDVG